MKKFEVKITMDVPTGQVEQLALLEGQAADYWESVSEHSFSRLVPWTSYPSGIAYL